MSETKHTPGPWAIRPLNGSYRIVPADHVLRPIGTSVFDAQNRDHYAQVIALTCPEPYGRGSQEANALLIAAAPDLAEALDWLLACVQATDADRADRLELAKHAAATTLARALGVPTP